VRLFKRERRSEWIT